MVYLGWFLVVYGVFVLWSAFAKPAWVWNTGKVQGFVKLLKETGTVILFVVFGLAALIGGVAILLNL
ncbi:MAG: hypothetical protein HKN46_07005 [Acidimicrobiia bacterium]|nr:hypothetical protein [Acidimicrobiia bacterium]